MSTKLTGYVWDGCAASGMKLSSVAIMARLADFSNDEGVCWPSIETIARQIGAGMSTVRTAIARLEAEGWLTRKARRQGTSGRWSYARQLYGHVYTAKIGTLSELVTAGDQFNQQHITLAGYEKETQTPADELAASRTARAAVFIRNDPARPTQTGELVGNGRGVDAGRALLSLQDDSFEAHRHESFFYAGISRNEIPLKNLPSSDEMLTLSSTTNALSPDGIDATNSLIGNDDYNCLIEGNKNNKRTATGLSTSIVGAAETRPRNISFNYIVRAA